MTIIKDLTQLEESHKKLIAAALEATKHSYQPYSHFSVGAAILDEHDQIHSGCNVEDAAYTGAHAEQGATHNMILSGSKQIVAAAIATKSGDAPCGGCRQRIWEHCKGDTNMVIYLTDFGNGIKQTTIGELLPFPFTLSH